MNADDLKKLFRRVTSLDESTENKPAPVSVVHRRKRAHVLERKEGAVTFAVDEVTPASQPLPAYALHKSMASVCGGSVLAMGGATANEPAAGTNADTTATQRLVIHHMLGKASAINPLIHAVHSAFSDHRPLVLTPDMIWLTIVQGFGHHVKQNAEALRGRIVRHEGQKTLRVNTPLPIDLPKTTSGFSQQIKEHSDPVLHETLLCRFSTTTPEIWTACEVALMDAYQRYFKYEVQCICGIPRITLEGTPDDWTRMRERLEVLATYELAWWTSRVAPILDEFIATAKGEPELGFWQAICKPRQAYGNKVVTGWITDLFPYLGGGEYVPRNSMLEKPRTNWLPADAHENNPFYPTGVSPESFPSGMSSAPVTLIAPDGRVDEIALMGGFVGVEQNADLTLRPVISWAAVKPIPLEPKEDIRTAWLRFQNLPSTA